MIRDVQKSDNTIIDGVNSFIKALTANGVICTSSEEERYTYCMCFLKTFHDVGVLNTEDAIRISGIFKQQCLNNLIDEDEIDSFCEDVEAYNGFFQFDRISNPDFIVEKVKCLGMSLQDDAENIYVFYAVYLWEDDLEIIRHRFRDTVKVLYDCSECIYGYNPFVMKIEDGYLIDYLPKTIIGSTKYIKLPEGIIGIRTNAFTRISNYDYFFLLPYIRECECLYLPKSLRDLEPECLSPLFHLKVVYYHFECAREVFIENYLLSEFDKKMSWDTSYIKLINDYDNLMSIADESVLDISDDTLVSCNETARGIINVPEGIHNVADKAFENCCYITEIHFPKSISYIGNSCFDGCGLLKELVFDDEARFVIEPSAWEKAPMLIESLKKEKVIIFGETLVVYRGMKAEYTIPEQVHFINKKAFAGRNMKQIHFDGDIEYIGDYAFAYNEELHGIKLPSSVRKTGVEILNRCPLFKLVLPNKFCITKENFRSIIGDPRIGGRLFWGYKYEVLDIYIDDIYYKEDCSFEYEWSEGYCSGLKDNVKKYRVNVVFHPRSALNDSM